jgi:DNA-binding NarL/FixJ family response regulator
MFWIEDPAGPCVLGVTSCYMDQLALRIASGWNHWNLRICPTVESALLVRENHPVSVIIYDLDTRDSHWRMGLRLLLSIGNPACLIALTDSPSDGLVRTMLQCGAYDVQSKPLKNNSGLAQSVNGAHRLISSCNSSACPEI